MGVKKRQSHVGGWIFLIIVALLVGYGLGHHDGKKKVTFTLTCENKGCGNETDCTQVEHDWNDCQRDLDDTRHNLAGCGEALQNALDDANRYGQEINVLKQSLDVCSNSSGVIYGCREPITNSGMFVPDNCRRIR